ncbi:MAG: hypothetical protein ABI457_12035 [Hyphomicrobium sp.]
MQMQIETRKADPAEDRGAFIGGVLACLLVLAALVAADIVFSPEPSPHQLTQGEATQSSIAKADPS